MSETLEARVQRLEDIEDIKQLIARYAKAADMNGDPALMTPCLTEDAVWNCEGIGGWKGRDAVVAGLQETCTVTLAWALHYMTQPIIEISSDGASATGDYYLWELAKATPDDGGDYKDTWIGGWYESKFRKEGNIWRFNHIELILKLMSEASAASWQTPIPPWKG